VVGGFLWTDGVILAGWALAKQIRNVIPDGQIDKYLVPAVALIVLISALPIFIEIYRGWRERRRGTGTDSAAAGAVDPGDAPTEVIPRIDRPTRRVRD